MTSLGCTSWSHDVLGVVKRTEYCFESQLNLILPPFQQQADNIWMSGRSGANLAYLIVKVNSLIGGITAYSSAHNALQNRKTQVKEHPFTDECTRYLDVEVGCRATDSSLSVCNRVISLLLGA
jgi:hypothetical protein